MVFSRRIARPAVLYIAIVVNFRLVIRRRDASRVRVRSRPFRASRSLQK
jgi:Fe2+ transport system protein FeoA